MPGPKLTVDISVIRVKFFMAYNSIFRKSQSLDKLVQLKIHEWFYLLLLQYSLFVVKLSSLFVDVTS